MSNIFEDAPIHKAFFSLALPSVFGKIIMVLYNLADTWFVASTGDANMVAGVSLISPIFMILIALGDIFAIGGSSIVSRLMGAQQKEDTKRMSTLCFYASLIFGTILMVILFLIKEPLMVLLGTDSYTYSHAADYYTYLVIGAPFILACNVPMNLLRSEGHAKASMVGSITGSVTNIVLDAVFIMGLHMGAAGAAIATVLGNVASILVYALFYRKAEWISVSPKCFHFSWSDMKTVAVVGVPASLTNIMNSIATTLTNRFLLPYGNDVIAAWNIAAKCTMICTMLIVSFSFSSLPLIGYNYGQKNYKRMKEILKFIFTFELCLTFACSILLTLCAPQLIAAFMNDAGIIANGTQILRCQLLGTCFMAIILICTCTFQATGNGKATLVSTLGRQGFVFIPVLFIFSHLWGYHGVLYTQPVTDLITTILVVTLLRKSITEMK